MTFLHFLLTAVVAAPQVVNVPVPAPSPAQVLSPPTVQPLAGKSYPRTPVPLDNPGTWVNTEDYPASALRDDAAGVTSFVLSIDKTGKVGRCEVTESSGTAILDVTTCALITERARFAPALDAKGRPVAGTYANRVRWQIPDIRDLPVAGVLVVAFVVETDGRVTNCRVERQEGAASKLGERASALCPKQIREPFRDAAGNPVRKVVRATQAISVRDLPETTDKAAN